MNQVEIPIVIQGIGAMRAELRELKGAIAEATNPPNKWPNSLPEQGS